VLALLGMDQASEVQRTMLSVLRRVAHAAPGALQPQWKELVPSICAIVQVPNTCRPACLPHLACMPACLPAASACMP
jgi:hypothetical protein